MLLDSFPSASNLGRLEFLPQPNYFIYRIMSLDGLFLVLNTTIYAIFSPIKVNIAEYLIPLGKTIVINAIPVSFFISFCAMSIPTVLDIRLFYFVMSGVFIINATTVGSAGEMPFYLITAGDLIKLTWQHPKYPFNDIGSMATNLMFLIGGGLVSWILLLGKRKFWRAE